MARTTIVQITDDLDGSSDAEEVAFSFDGAAYTIDLSKKNRAAFEKALKPYLAAATKVGQAGSTRSRKRKSPSSAGPDMRSIREWARGNGIRVSDRGRVPRAVMEQYKAAN